MVVLECGALKREFGSQGLGIISKSRFDWFSRERVVRKHVYFLLALLDGSPCLSAFCHAMRQSEKLIWTPQPPEPQAKFYVYNYVYVQICMFMCSYVCRDMYE